MRKGQERERTKKDHVCGCRWLRYLPLRRYDQPVVFKANCLGVICGNSVSTYSVIMSMIQEDAYPAGGATESGDARTRSQRPGRW